MCCGFFVWAFVTDLKWLFVRRMSAEKVERFFAVISENSNFCKYWKVLSKKMLLNTHRVWNDILAIISIKFIYCSILHYYNIISTCKINQNKKKEKQHYPNIFKGSFTWIVLKISFYNLFTFSMGFKTCIICFFTKWNRYINWDLRIWGF